MDRLDGSWVRDPWPRRLYRILVARCFHGIFIHPDHYIIVKMGEPKFTLPTDLSMKLPDAASVLLHDWSFIIVYPYFSLVAVTGAGYTYIIGVDRTDVLLLCDPEDGGSLSVLRWSLSGMQFFNPINLNSESSNLPDVLTTFSCIRGGDTLVTTQICVKGICK